MLIEGGLMKFLKVEVFIPEDFVTQLANELNENGILEFENYDYVFSTTPVIGRFRPLEGANPFLGTVGKVERVNEMKMEFGILEENKEEVLKIIDYVHPYESPVVNFLELV